MVKRNKKVASTPRKQVDIVSASAPRLIGIPDDPPHRAQQVNVAQVFQREVKLTTSTFDITPAIISAAVPGGATYWTSMRVNSIAVWGESLVSNVSVPSISGAISLLLPADLTWGQPLRKFTDSGVQGHTRPKLHVRLGALQRMRFFGPADTTVLATIQGAEGERLTIQFSVELVSSTVV
jgi:hypothetical protein